MSNYKLREACIWELPYISDICIDDNRDTLVINNQKDANLLNLKLYNQTTNICGDLSDLIGFVNYGDRPLQKFASNAKYIRTVYVSPKYAGQGIATDFINQTIQEMGEDPKWNVDKGVWMQISEKNASMQKVANKTGFKKVDVWDYDDSRVGIWLKK